MKAFQKTAHTTFTNLIVLLLAIVMFVIVLSQLGSGAYVQDTDSYEMTTQWQMEDGQVLALAELPAGEVTVSHSLEGMDLREKRFCLKSSDTFLSVQADGVQVYEYAPVYPPILGVSYGNYLHMIPLPSDAQTLTMTLTPAYDGITFENLVLAVIQPRQIRKLRTMVNFSFRRHPSYNLPEDRLCAIEKQLRERAIQLLALAKSRKEKNICGGS